MKRDNWGIKMKIDLGFVHIIYKVFKSFPSDDVARTDVFKIDI